MRRVYQPIRVIVSFQRRGGQPQLGRRRASSTRNSSFRRRRRRRQWRPACPGVGASVTIATTAPAFAMPNSQLERGARCNTIDDEDTGRGLSRGSMGGSGGIVALPPAQTVWARTTQVTASINSTVRRCVFSGASWRFTRIHSIW